MRPREVIKSLAFLQTGIFWEAATKIKAPDMCKGPFWEILVLWSTAKGECKYGTCQSPSLESVPAGS